MSDIYRRELLKNYSPSNILKRVDVKRVKKTQLKNLARIKTTYLPRTRNTVISKTPSLNLRRSTTPSLNLGQPNRRPMRPIGKPWALRDMDRDGVPNYMDRYPNDPTRR